MQGLTHTPGTSLGHGNVDVSSTHRGAQSTLIGSDRFSTVALVVLCQVAHFLTLAAIPLLLPAIREDLGINFTQAGMISAAGMLSYALAQIPAGYLSDRYGPRRLVFIGLLSWSFLSFGFGLVHAFLLPAPAPLRAGGFL